MPGDSDPMLNLDDRDLVTLAEVSGFRRVRLTLALVGRGIVGREVCFV
jgi:hypothetical protein